MKTDDDSRVTSDCGEFSSLLFGVRRSVRYHNRRRRFFDNLSKFSGFIKVVSGTGTFAAVATSSPEKWVKFWSLAVAGFSAADLIFQTSQHARLHYDLAKRFIALEREITVASAHELSPMELNAFCAKRLEIEADEPPPLRNLDSLCHNELCKAMGSPKGEFVRVRFYQSFFAQWFDLFEDSVKKISSEGTTG